LSSSLAFTQQNAQFISLVLPNVSHLLALSSFFDSQSRKFLGEEYKSRSSSLVNFLRSLDFRPLRPKCVSQHHILESCQPIFFP
jgi:hypothetical protein